jgi:DNA invertase Pin-like site-specific DNA recombinase
LPLSDESATGSPESLANVKSGAGEPSSTISRPSLRRAIGVVRVSRIGEDAVSPVEQRERIASTCERDGLELLDVLEELDVSGGAPLAKRPGLGRAVQLVEDGAADVVVVAYFDRLVRSLAVQAEVVERVERAGGAILAVDVGHVTNGSAGQWLSGTLLGAVSEYARRVTAERTEDAKRRAVERGVPPFPNVPPGYRRRDDGSLEPHPEQARVVAGAFQMRANGATVMDVREHLRQHGIERSFHGVQALLGSRIVLGELRFGEIVNTSAHLAIVDAPVWQKVQRMRVSRGRRAQSERLLARLGVLRCATCGSRMVIGSTDQNGKRHYMYRCPPIGDCPRRVTISADIAEGVVVERVRELLRDKRGSATSAEGVARAEHELAAIEDRIKTAVRAFAGLEDVSDTQEVLDELREQRENARDRADELRAAAGPAATLDGGVDFDALPLDKRRALIRALIDEARVAPGRGPGRITVKPRGE